MDLLAFVVFLIVSALLWALMEIQIEGKNGWAAALPTWRYKVYIKYLWEREITGYHVYLMTFIVILLHSIFLYIPWTIALELKVMSFFLLLSVIEDFLWFVLNPSFGIRKFNKTEVVWHTQWLLGIPTFYWVVLPLGVFLYAISLTL